jgi:predicted PurR-regulated permease PerM
MQIITRERSSFRDQARLVAFSVLFVFSVLLAGYLVVRAWSVLQLFVIGIVIAMAINPMVVWLARRRVGRGASVMVMVLLVFIVAGVALWALLPVLADQVTQFARTMPDTLGNLEERAARMLDRVPGVDTNAIIERVRSGLSEGATALAGRVASILSAGANAVVQTFLGFFLVMMILLEPKPLIQGLLGVFPADVQPEIERVGALCVQKVQGWIQGTLILCVVIGAFTGAGLSLLHVKYALLWGVLAGLFELIPTLGPILSAIPPILIALADNPVLAGMVVLVFVLAHALENYVLVPFVMGSKLELHPVTLLLFMTVMAKLMGIFGAVMAMPTAAVLKVVYQEVYYRRLHGSLPEPVEETFEETTEPPQAGDGDAPEAASVPALPADRER